MNRKAHDSRFLALAATGFVVAMAGAGGACSSRSSDACPTANGDPDDTTQDPADTDKTPVVLWSGYHCNVGNLAQDATFLYWGSGNSITEVGLYRIGKDGTGQVTLVNEAAVNVAVATNAILWSTDSPMEVRKASLDGSGPTTLASAAGFGGVYDLHADGSTAFFSDGNGLHSIGVDGTGLTTLDALGHYYFALAGGTVFYVNGADFSLRRIQYDGTGQATLLAQTAFWVSAGNSYVYASNQQSETYRMELDGGNSSLLELAGGPVVATSGGVYLAAGQHIYYVNSDGSGLRRVTALARNPRACVVDDQSLYCLAMDGSCNGEIISIPR